jgi:hypothetical protein
MSFQMLETALVGQQEAAAFFAGSGGEKRRNLMQMTLVAARDPLSGPVPGAFRFAARVALRLAGLVGPALLQGLEGIESLGPEAAAIANVAKSAT